MVIQNNMWFVLVVTRTLIVCMALVIMEERTKRRETQDVQLIILKRNRQQNKQLCITIFFAHYPLFLLNLSQLGELI